MKLCFYPNDLKIAPKKSPRFTIHKECIMTFISLFSVLGTYCHQQSYPILIISPTQQQSESSNTSPHSENILPPSIITLFGDIFSVMAEFTFTNIPPNQIAFHSSHMQNSHSQSVHLKRTFQLGII